MTFIALDLHDVHCRKGTPPAPNSAAGYDATLLQEAPAPGTGKEAIPPQPYNNVHGIVTGPLPGDYLERGSHQSRSSTPSKLSVQSGLSGDPVAVDGIKLSVSNLAAVNRPMPPSRSNSRPMSPAGSGVHTVTRTVVTYSTDPGVTVGVGAVYAAPSTGRSTPASVIAAPYAYPNAGGRDSMPPPPPAESGTDRAADYYQRRYGVPMDRSASKDSVV